MTSPIVSPVKAAEPPRDCDLCPRVVALREECRAEHPTWWNGPVSAFGDPTAQIVLVGTAPGKHGANRTGRPFTGDYEGGILYATLEKFGFSQGVYNARADDGLTLVDLTILNGVKCLPPQNKPSPEESRACRQFLASGVELLTSARIFIALGQVAHKSTVKVLGGRLPKTPFSHLAEHRMPDGRIVIDSEHCSRSNMNSGRLTVEQFEAVFVRAIALRDAL